MHKINKTAVAFLRRYATLFIKKTQYLLSRLRMNSLWRRTILNASACALAMFSGKIF